MAGHRRFPSLGPVAARLFALAAALILLPASSGLAQNRVTEIATYDGPDREKRLIERFARPAAYGGADALRFQIDL